MKSKLILFPLLIFPLLFIQCSGGDKLHRQLVKMAENMNSTAPVQLDNHTLFLGADVTEENLFQYRYRLLNTDDPQSLMEAVEEQTRTNIREAFRLNPDLRIFTVNDVRIDYIYTDSVGNVVKTIHITPEDYK
ncbi:MULTISPECIES: hypothetical protein [Petrimonas]|jgi:hypothetical protein|uniref:Uncharacterized protein n=2 Tax=Petrimonas mucosa TaxID=1642646 RepID=A0A1G4G4G2_9BACT|nr:MULTISPECIES: hypothetical protein [Petrimonas]MDD3560711.1 hypothetical protein [Petrimonas mucosa]SCM55841.1 putative protein {ECO:0000313/EMBL:CEA16680,1} [Petrimonas mucosa]SFU45262.1 hypothetical protein SAMN05216364_101332 [Porphyromonadaceae bacterium KHP3R9]HHT30516.1 hypothetical protein [Petrimonas mucosa]